MTVADALDYETDASHTITVKATSTDGEDNTQTFTINVSDVTTEGPSLANQVVAFNEGIAATTEIINFADASGGDTDGDGDALTYSITAGNDSGIFAIAGSTGVVTIASGKTLEYATASVHTLTIQATDGANTDTATLTVNVNNVLTADPTISDSNGANNTVAENAAIGTTVGLTAAAAFASGDTASVSRFEITASTGGTSGANTLGKFAIDPSTGVVTVADALDYEADASHTITVKATSTDGQDNTQIL